MNGPYTSTTHNKGRASAAFLLFPLPPLLDAGTSAHFFEIFEYGLPPPTLHFDRISVSASKVTVTEVLLNTSSKSTSPSACLHRICDFFMQDDRIVRAPEINPHFPSLASIREVKRPRRAGSLVALGEVPVIGRVIPFHDELGIGVHLPHVRPVLHDNLHFIFSVMLTIISNSQFLPEQNHLPFQIFLYFSFIEKAPVRARGKNNHTAWRTTRRLGRRYFLRASITCGQISFRRFCAPLSALVIAVVRRERRVPGE